MTEEIETMAQEKDWVNIIFLTLTPIIGVVGTALYTWRNGFEPWMLVLMLTMYALVGMSICAGYHRFFSHKSYEASRPVQYFFAFFGAMAAQNSILWWSSSHRVHHKYVDKDWDPYNIRRGFWWAHIFWIFHRNPQSGNFDNAKDLLKNPVVMWQHKWHKVILIVGGFGIPTLIGAMFGDPIAGLLWGGFTRLMVVHHSTFFVNSLAHYLGEPTYNPDSSARDNWFVALLTLGEGYHSFHHRFPADFRNGIRWYHWDPAKWFIGTLRFFGQARHLRVTSAPMIEQARLQAAATRVESAMPSLPGPMRHEINARIEKAKQRMDEAVSYWKAHVEAYGKGQRKRWRATKKLSRMHAKQARLEWTAAVRLVQASMKAA
jgi:stearoyl-CoA desaturase (Delta-9 desaturase)